MRLIHYNGGHMQRNVLVVAVTATLLIPGLALAESSSTGEAASGASVTTTSPNYTASMSRLQEAAQRLRESIQAMAQQPAGPGREKAIEQAHQALYDTQSAMIQLPPALRSGAGSSAQPNYTKSMEKLQQAAQKLRESVQAMAQQPAGERRNQAAQQAREALLETQQAMVMLPPELRTAQGK
jgi:hypothetical protein